MLSWSSLFARRAVAPLVALSLGACATRAVDAPAPRAAEAPTLTSAEAPAPADFGAALARARGARDRALALRPPGAPDLPWLPDGVIGDALRAWSESRRDATQAAHRAYTEALHAASGPADEAVVYGELADLWLRLEDDARLALFAAAPPDDRGDPSFVSAVEGASAYAFAPLAQRVSGLLDACQQLGAANAGLEASACDDAGRRFRESGDPRGPTAVRRAADPPRVAPPRAVVATTRPTPCTFKGTLLTRGAVYADASGGSIALHIDRETAIEVESLAVPAQKGGRYKVVVTWPQAVEGYLEPAEAPFVITRPGEAGEAVTASDPRGPTVAVAGASSAGGARRMFCHDLALATPARR